MIIVDELGMNNTRITLSDILHRSHLAIGHINSSENPIYFENPLPLAAAFHSSSSDMVKYLSANIGLIKKY